MFDASAVINEPTSSQMHARNLAALVFMALGVASALQCPPGFIQRNGEKFCDAMEWEEGAVGPQPWTSEVPVRLADGSSWTAGTAFRVVREPVSFIVSFRGCCCNVQCAPWVACSLRVFDCLPVGPARERRVRGGRLRQRAAAAGLHAGVLDRHTRRRCAVWSLIYPILWYTVCSLCRSDVWAEVHVPDHVRRAQSDALRPRGAPRVLQRRQLVSLSAGCNVFARVLLQLSRRSLVLAIPHCC